jgi:dihydroneopterin aldolase
LKPQLLETLANQLAELVLSEHPSVTKVQICAKKPLAVKAAQAVGIDIIRERHEILARAGQ